MEINRINYSTNFKSNMPIYKVLKRGLDGLETELQTYAQIRGPIQALVKRLNNEPNARETLFFKQHLKDFAKTPEVTTTIEGNHAFAKKHIIFGDDVAKAGELRNECYRKGKMTEPQIKDYIVRSLIEPIQNKIKVFRFKDDKVGEQVGLVVHVAKNGKAKYDIGFDVTNIDGKIYASLPLENSAKKTVVQPELLPTKKVETIVAKVSPKIEQATLPGFDIPQPKYDSSRPWPKYFDHCPIKHPGAHMKHKI